MSENFPKKVKQKSGGLDTYEYIDKFSAKSIIKPVFKGLKDMDHFN